VEDGAGEVSLNVSLERGLDGVREAHDWPAGGLGKMKRIPERH